MIPLYLIVLYDRYSKKCDTNVSQRSNTVHSITSQSFLLCIANLKVEPVQTGGGAVTQILLCVGEQDFWVAPFPPPPPPEISPFRR